MVKNKRVVATDEAKSRNETPAPQCPGKSKSKTHYKCTQPSPAQPAVVRVVFTSVVADCLMPAAVLKNVSVLSPIPIFYPSSQAAR